MAHTHGVVDWSAVCGRGNINVRLKTVLLFLCSEHCSRKMSDRHVFAVLYGIFNIFGLICLLILQKN